MGEIFNRYTTTAGDYHWSDTEFGEHTIKAHKELVYPSESTGGMIGWICPICGRGLSPFTSYCPCKGWPKMEVTC